MFQLVSQLYVREADGDIFSSLSCRELAAKMVIENVKSRKKA